MAPATSSALNPLALRSPGWKVPCQALTLSPQHWKKPPLLGRGVSVLQGILVLLALLGGAYAAGYFTRDYISRRRRENARIWKNYIDPEWLRQKHGDLGQMLSRWEDRARARRSR